MSPPHATGQKPLFTTQTSTEEIRAIKTVLCDGVPPQLLNKQVLTRHFSRFGNVVKVCVCVSFQTSPLGSRVSVMSLIPSERYFNL